MARVEFFDGQFYDGDFFDPFCYDESFFDGNFFDGAFFDVVCTITEPPPDVETVTMPYWDVAVMQRQDRGKRYKKQDLETLLLLLG